MFFKQYNWYIFQGSIISLLSIPSLVSPSIYFLKNCSFKSQNSYRDFLYGNFSKIPTWDSIGALLAIPYVKVWNNSSRISSRIVHICFKNTSRTIARISPLFWLTSLVETCGTQISMCRKNKSLYSAHDFLVFFEIFLDKR